MNKKSLEIIITRIDKAYNRMRNHLISNSVLFDIEYAGFDGFKDYSGLAELKYEPVDVGTAWGRAWDRACFRVSAIVPAGWQGNSVVAELDFSGEGLVFGPAGQIIQGISTASIFNPDYARTLVALFDRCHGNERVELWIEAVAGGLFGVHLDQDPAETAPDRYGSFQARVVAARLGIFRESLWHYWLDLRIALGLIRRLHEGSVRRARLIRAANNSLDVYADDPERAGCARVVLRAELDRPACASALKVCAVGHAHIDTAWLWPISETIRKCARTFATQLDLIDRYPDYVFGASQPQHYQFIKTHYPDIYERIRKAVKDGRWELQGGMWVEADCNLIGGESMIRQILQGKNFFRDEFGVDVDTLWLPDVFGYSAAMPQIMRRSGIRYFLTQKISWSRINEFPHHTFMWRGIDGSEVLTHFPPENNYNSELDADILLQASDRYKQKDLCSEMISLFGVGDGGGGPKADHIELGRRMADLEGAPRVRFAAAARGFAGLEAYRDELPVWSGELYLELHRGTLTTQSGMKRLNRKMEQSLCELEILYASLPLDQYPSDRLDALWKILLLHQFHDILPGSSITRVYREATQAFERMFEECRKLRDKAANSLFEKDNAALTIINTNSHPFRGAVRLPESWRDHDVRFESGEPVPMQQDPGGPVALVGMEAFSFLVLRKGRPDDSTGTSHDAADKGLVLENKFARYVFSENGSLVSASDLECGREILVPGGTGNALALYEDRPNQWDAWDIDFFYEKTKIAMAGPVSHGLISNGPVRSGIQFKTTIGKSLITQNIYLDSVSKRLDFETMVEWHEKHRMLRVSFPVAVRTDRAAFDIQHGYVMRNTHRNTSWDEARFEVAAHRYVDISDPDYGVALLNDCKYGHKVYGNVIDLNLLRSTTYPDPDADRGEHRFVYSLYPHKNDLIRSDVIAQAAQLNRNPRIFDGFATRSSRFPWRIEAEGIGLEGVKKAEKENCLILRLVEIHGKHSAGRLVMDAPAARLIETDLMEWADGGKILYAGPVEIRLGPFEIRTIKVFC